MFYLVAAGVVLLAIGIVILPPLFKKKPIELTSADEPSFTNENLRENAKELLRSRLAELKNEKSQGLISTQEYQALVDEAAANHLSARDTKEQGEFPSSQQQPGKFWILGFAILVPVLSFSLYPWLGEPDASWLQGSVSQLQAETPDKQKLQALSTRLDKRLKGKPFDAGSWYLLGLARLQLEDFKESDLAFSRVDALQGQQINVDLYWLQARFLSAGGVLDKKSLAIGKRILEQSPNQPVALEILALAAYRAGQFSDSVSLLNRALSQSLRADLRATLTAGLLEARARLGDQMPLVDVQVAAAENPPNNAQVFVIARPVGSRMPLAVVRRPAAALPLTVRLDDAVAMNPAMGLSSADKIEVIVRLSINGQPISAPGDWEWKSEVIDIKGKKLNFSVLLSPPK